MQVIDTLYHIKNEEVGKVIGRVSFEEQAELLRNKGEWIVGRLVCTNCGKIYELSSYKKAGDECNVCKRRTLVEEWKYASQWKTIEEKGFIDKYHTLYRIEKILNETPIISMLFRKKKIYRIPRDIPEEVFKEMKEDMFPKGTVKKVVKKLKNGRIVKETVEEKKKPLSRDEFLKKYEQYIEIVRKPNKKDSKK